MNTTGMTQLERFEDKFIPVTESGCWLWTASCYPGGYGMFFFNGVVNGAHRASWEIHNGPIPDGARVCHSCDVESCVNPDHLFLGSARDNTMDMVMKGRHGRAILTPADAKEIKSATGVSNADLAKQYSVRTKVVWRIRNNLTWRHVK